jgi:hypothetical protein
MTKIEIKLLDFQKRKILTINNVSVSNIEKLKLFITFKFPRLR